VLGLAPLLAAAVPAALPALPPQGFAVERGDRVVLESRYGKRLATLGGFSLELPAPPHRVVLRAAGGFRYRVDGRSRLIPLPPGKVGTPLERAYRSGCFFVTETGALPQILMCPRAITWMETTYNARRILAGPQSRVGHWAWAELSPDRRTVLAQWSAECETPIAFFVPVRRHHAKPVSGTNIVSAPESVGLGWLRGNRAVVHFPEGLCGGGLDVPGVYLVPVGGRPRLIVRTPRRSSVAMWGG